MNYCSGCHSLKFMRYSRMAEDLGLTEDEVMQNLNFTGAKFGEQVQVAMPVDGATKWFGKMPPDLSVISRVRGSDWIYTYLKSFYLDESRPLGWNNTLFPNASMPNPLWQMQGLQRPVYGKNNAATGETPVEHLELGATGHPERGAVRPDRARHHHFSRVRRRTVRTQAPEPWRVGDPVPGVLHVPGVPAEIGILERRPLSVGVSMGARRLEAVATACKGQAASMRSADPVVGEADDGCEPAYA